MVAQTEVGKHTDAETRVILRNIGKPRLAVLGNKAVVCKLHILHVDTHKEAIMQSTVVYIWFVLHLTLLRHHTERKEKQCYYV